MDILLVSLVLLLAVIVSSWTSRALPFAVPLPIVQILIGIGIAEWTSFSVTIDPAFFFAFFIPALLYLRRSARSLTATTTLALWRRPSLASDQKPG